MPKDEVAQGVRAQISMLYVNKWMIIRPFRIRSPIGCFSLFPHRVTLFE